MLNHDALAASLEQFHPPEQWVFAVKVRTVAGWPHYYGQDKERYIDAFAMNCYPSKGHLRVAYEVKVSRADWLRELREPDKCAPAIALSHRFYFVLADGIWRPEDRKLVSADAGVREVYDGEKPSFRTLVRAPTRNPGVIPEGFVAMLLRSVRATARRTEL